MSSTTDYPQPDSILNADRVPTDGTLTIIAGSRSATDLLSDDGLQTLLSSVIDAADFEPTAVVSGTARGVDQAGEDWATDNGRLPVAQFPAPWDDIDHPDAVVRDGRHGKYDARAGHRRNEWMAEYAAQHGNRGVLVAILVYDENGEPSNGTSDMIELGREHLGDDNVFVVPLGNVDEAHVSDELAPVAHRS